MKKEYQNPIAEIEKFRLSSITTDSGFDNKGNDLDGEDDDE